MYASQSQCIKEKHQIIHKYVKIWDEQFISSDHAKKSENNNKLCTYVQAQLMIVLEVEIMRIRHQSMCFLE